MKSSNHCKIGLRGSIRLGGQKPSDWVVDCTFKDDEAPQRITAAIDEMFYQMRDQVEAEIKHILEGDNHG